MFDPSDFLSIAKWLLTKEEIREEEAMFRTSISRAYYSVLLIVKRHLETMGFSIPEDHRVHEKAEKLLKMYIDRTAGDELGGLRRMRRDADYNLDKNIRSGKAQNAIKMAENIVNRVTERA